MHIKKIKEELNNLGIIDRFSAEEIKKIDFELLYKCSEFYGIIIIKNIFINSNLSVENINNRLSGLIIIQNKIIKTLSVTSINSYTVFNNLIKEYFNKEVDKSLERLTNELSSLPSNYIINSQIPLNYFLDQKVLCFINDCGLKNIIEFDNECGHFFTNNNCEMLKKMYDYVIYTFTTTDTKEEFYELMKNIVTEFYTINYSGLNGNFRKKYPFLFISEKAPLELKENFYQRNLSFEFIFSNSKYIDYLKELDLNIFIKHLDKNFIVNSGNLLAVILKVLGNKEGFDILLSYGKYLEKALMIDKVLIGELKKITTKEDLLIKLDNIIYQAIILGMKYDEYIPEHFKKKHKTLFLKQDVPLEIKNKFYNRSFSLDDFNSNLDILELLGDTNIICGFSDDLSWLYSLYNDYDNVRIANYKKLKIIMSFLKIKDTEMQNIFKKYILEHEKNLDNNKIETITQILTKLAFTNSSEMYKFKKNIAEQILNTPNPLENLKKIENIFVENNVPTVGKIYSCFEILYPSLQEFRTYTPNLSPVLKRVSEKNAKFIIFSDLIKATFGSNNHSVNTFINNIENSSKLYKKIILGEIQYEKLTQNEKEELFLFRKILITLYSSTMKGKKEEKVFTTSENIISDIYELSSKLSSDGLTNIPIEDRVVRMFCALAGINTLKEAKEYITNKIKVADLRNRNNSSNKIILEKGDFIKGIDDINYLRNILQNGSVSKEFLGKNAKSDSTPLDTDLSMILNDEGTIKDIIDSTDAKFYGPIWFVLKNDDRFIITRDGNGTLDVKNDMSKLEVFYTGVYGKDHYGIRTGFASSEINYIIVKEYDYRIGLEITINGFYIPVLDTSGRLVFTPEDYDNIRQKMAGLSYYGENNYIFSKKLITKETEYFVSQIEQSNNTNIYKSAKIKDIIKKSLNEFGLDLKTKIDGNLTEGSAELIDIGSTGRGTSKSDNSNFTFIMRLDKNILFDSTKGPFKNKSHLYGVITKLHFSIPSSL